MDDYQQFQMSSGGSGGSGCNGGCLNLIVGIIAIFLGLAILSGIAGLFNG